MSKPASKSLIGAFILGGLLLAIATVVLLGGGRFLTKRTKFTAYFQGNVRGLQIGSPVTFKGVPIGQVTDIDLQIDQNSLSYTLPVEFEIDRSKLHGVKGVGAYHYLDALIEKGLRAQLQAVSFVTGQLVVSLEFFPGSPATLVGGENARYPEIPTVPTDLEEFQRRLSELPLEEIARSFNHTLAGVDHLVNSPAARGLSTQSSKALEDFERLLHSLNSLADYLSRHPEALIRGKEPSKGDKK